MDEVLEDYTMLIKLNSNDIAKYWEGIIDTLRRSRPGDDSLNSPEVEKNLLQSALTDAMQCWILFDAVGMPKALGTSTVVIDHCTKLRSLVITSLYSLGGIVQAEWSEALEIIYNFATAQKCYQVVAEIEIPQLIHLAKELGADTSTTIAKWRIT